MAINLEIIDQGLVDIHNLHNHQLNEIDPWFCPSKILVKIYRLNNHYRWFDLPHRKNHANRPKQFAFPRFVNSPSKYCFNFMLWLYNFLIQCVQCNMQPVLIFSLDLFLIPLEELQYRTLQELKNTKTKLILKCQTFAFFIRTFLPSNSISAVL